MAHKLLAKQIAKATSGTSEVDVAKLIGLVSDAYEEADRDRRRTERSMSLMIDELDRHANRDRELLLAQLSTQNARFESALENMSHGLSMFDGNQQLIICNNRYSEMYGLGPDLTAPGTTFAQILDHLTANKGLSPSDREETLNLLMSGEPWSKVMDLLDGRVLTVSCQPMSAGGWVSTHQDVTEQRRAQAKISHMARHDALTDLPNRLSFREVLENSLGALPDGNSLAVLCLDLDRFKSVNDSLGHPVGDRLLVAVAKRLRDCIRDTDTAARLGGDEFAILQVGDPQPIGATALAERLVEAIGQGFEIDGHQIDIGASVGITISPNDGSSADQLIKNADMALYQAKSGGRATFRFFEPAMDAQMKTRRAMELGLRKALVNREFELFYQPVISLKEGQVTGFEALLRWRHPEHGMVLPGEFIPLAEEVGLIIPIGAWALRRACAEAASWPGELAVAVNLSPVQFKTKNLVQIVSSALDAAGLNPSRLMLEITETVLMDDSDSPLKTLHELRDLGVKIAMDDFGTGYSSLGYLRRFPFDRIKIDRSFVSDFPGENDSVSIVRAVAGLGASLGMATTAEGVETEEQLNMLRQQGCTDVQGFFYSAAVPAADVGALVGRLNRSVASGVKAVA